MKEQDDLFEFGDFDDYESLELNLDDLFGDLDVLSFDPNQLDAPAASEPIVSVPTATAPAPAPAAPQPAPTASAAQPSAPQPTYAAAQPVAAAQLPPGQVYYAPAAPAPAATKSSRLQLVTITIAAIVTVANFAVMALPKAGNQPAAERTSTAPIKTTELPNQDVPNDSGPSAADLALIARIQQLESQLQTINTPTDATPSTPNQRHRAFDEIEVQIASGDYQAARGRLYSLLAVVDRFDAVRAREIEDQASYLLADTYRLEAEAQEHNL